MGVGMARFFSMGKEKTASLLVVRFALKSIKLLTFILFLNKKALKSL